jgi:hypothetical protein
MGWEDLDAYEKIENLNERLRAIEPALPQPWEVTPSAGEPGELVDGLAALEGVPEYQRREGELLQMLQGLAALEGVHTLSTLGPFLYQVAAMLVAMATAPDAEFSIGDWAKTALRKLEEHQGRDDAAVLFAIGCQRSPGFDIRDEFGGDVTLPVVSFFEMMARAGLAMGGPGEPAPRPEPDTSGSGQPSHPGEGGS